MATSRAYPTLRTTCARSHCGALEATARAGRARENIGNVTGTGLRGGVPRQVLLAACLLMGCTINAPLPSGLSASTSASVPASLDPATTARLVLQPDDLGPVGGAESFVLFDEGPLARADAGLPPRADPARFGRLGGWKARYKRADTSARAGVLVIDSRVDVFPDDSGASADLDAYRELWRQRVADGNWETIQANVAGNPTVGLRSVRQRGAVRDLELAWSAGRYTGLVALSGLDESVSPETAQRLADLVSARMKADGG
jgi:hypothetical protein